MQDHKAFFKGKRITLMGLGLLGRGVGDARFLAECGAKLVVTDLKHKEELAPSLEALKDYKNITYRLGDHRLEDFRDCDMVLKAAGVPLDSPYIAEAKKNNIPVRMSADLFAQFAHIPIVGVTGTRGKSTVTHMLAHILKVAGTKVLLGGNVRGVSTLELLNDSTPDAVAVCELDSWQLQGFGEAKVSPQVAVFTTFMPDHMNYYKNNMNAYFTDKANIFLNQKADDVLVIGEQVVSTLEQYGYKNKIRARAIVAGAKDFPKQWKIKLPGEHNRYNAGLAVVVAEELGVDTNIVRSAIESFEGVPGRLELIREIDGVKIYNDTTATVPEATLAALKALRQSSGQNQNIILILGGADKGLDMNELLREIPNYCKKVILLAGTGTERIKDELGKSSIYETIREAIKEAFRSAASGDIILMSPAFASFGMFKNEFDRGDQFNNEVKKLS